MDMASFIFNPLHQKQLFSLTLCKCSPSPSPSPSLFNFNFNISSSSSHLLSFPSTTTRSPQHTLSHPLPVRENASKTDIPPTTPQEHSKDTTNRRIGRETGSGFSRFKSKDKWVAKKSVKNKDITAIVEEILEKTARKDREIEKRLDYRKREKGPRKNSSNVGGEVVSQKIKKKPEKGNNDEIGEEKIGKHYKKNKVKKDLPGAKLKMGLDMCSKRGDVKGATELYDSAVRDGVKLVQYHYTVLLYLCSSAATGVVQPAKSGSGNGNRSLSGLESNREVSAGSEELEKLDRSKLNGLVDCSNSSIAELNGNSFPRKVVGDGIKSKSDKGIQVSLDLKKYALMKGFEIYKKMLSENVPMNEPTLTSVARMAMSMGDGDMAFDMVKQMKKLGLSPRLRSYVPALTVFCNNGDIEEAFSVEQHMLEHGVYPEEPELEALLKLSIEVGRSDKVYYLLQKLRTSVRQVSPSTAELIEKWFKSAVASRVGKRKWDEKLIREAIENGGGGWHGQGWLGKGKWNVSHTSVGNDGLCKCCGEKLATIDLDPTETENFAQSVASIALQRDNNSSFQKFQKWLDYYGPFEAVVDAANVGLFSQRKFNSSKVNAVVNGIRQMLPSKKWPLIVLHNRRISGENMDKPINMALIEKWRNADALYATPTGSNDDWYWLYAAIKFKCLMVTNDEMRDHLFQLLGNDFFPKWKERHQVHFSFSEAGPEFHMPPPCSVVVQESEKGHWHLPIVSEHNSEEERTWLCVTRPNSRTPSQVSTTKYEDHHRTILPEIEAAENRGNCVIDFEI